MRIEVDRDLCESNAVCVQWAPDVFHVDETGAMVLAKDRPSLAVLGEVKDAAKRCPRGAITLVDD
jgi:ferredoxin